MTKLITWLASGWINWLTAGVGLAALIGALWFGFHRWEESLRQEGRAEVQADWDADVNERRLAYAGQMEVERVKGAQHAQDIAKERKARERDGILVGSVLADTRSQLERLRATSAAVTARAVQASASAATGPGADDAAQSLGAVFAECSGRLVEVGQQAEDLGVRLRGLQAWASSAVMVCAPD